MNKAYDFYVGPKPLNFPGAERTGSFKLVSVISENSYNAGDTVVLSQYITGYGAGVGFKVICYMSEQLFEEDISILSCGLLQTTGENPMLKWGADQLQLLNGGFTIGLSSMKNERWSAPAQIFDTKENFNYILTERNLSGAPFSYNLTLGKKVRPGVHYLSFYMTYFNGSEWVCEGERIPMKINNTFERYSAHISVLAAVALIVTIFHDGFWPLVECAHELGKLITGLHKS